MRKYFLLLLIILLLLLNTGCDTVNPSVLPSDGPTAAPSDLPEDNITDDETSESIYIAQEWTIMNASYARDGSSQYDNATLMMKYLSNGCTLFEFRLMEGSESEDIAFDIILSGVLIINEDGEGIYETESNADNPISVHFVLSDDGHTVDVTHNGNIEISPDGRYEFIDNNIEVSDTSVGQVLAFLPVAATSLDSSLGEFTIEYPEALISDWFYYVNAIYNNNGEILASFLIAKDLSAIFRADDDIEPILIFGSTQPMMEAYTMELTGASSDDEPEYETRPLVSVELDSGSTLMPGYTGLLIAKFPVDLPYLLSATSLDEAVAIVDEDGIVTAIDEGETEISCIITCEDGIANISIPIFVTKTLEIDTIIYE